MSQYEIKKALVTKLLSLTLPALNYDNLASTEVVPFVDVFIFFSQPSVATLGADGEDGQSGFLQLTLNMPIDDGDGATFALYETIAQEFKAGSKCLFGDQQVTISNCGKGSGITQDGKYITPITINWYARTRR